MTEESRNGSPHLPASGDQKLVSSSADEKTPVLSGSISYNVSDTNVNISTEDGTGEKVEKVEFSFRKLDRTKKMTFLTLAFVNFCACTCFSLLAPFFPHEAEQKGASQTVIGLIFSCFEFVIFISSPFFGANISRIGPKFMFISGVFVCGVCAILFGLLDKSPNGTIFIVMCFASRTIEALGTSAFITASFAIVAYSFPDNVATVFGTLETFSGLGLMVGPPIGGALYELGGYGLPFWTLGCLVLSCGLICYFIMPAPTESRKPYKGSVFSLLKSLQVWVTCLSIFTGSFSLGFLDPTLAKHLEPFNLSTLIVGFIFLIAPGVYGFTAPLWGWIGDAKGQVKSLMIFGNFFATVGFLLMGPCPLLPFLPFELWLIIISLLMFGLFVGCALIPTLNSLLQASKKLGFEDNIDTYGLVSGLFNSAFCLGTFTGPTVGGILIQNFNFAWAATVVAGLFLFAAILVSIFVCADRKPCHKREIEYSIIEGVDSPNPREEETS